MALCFTVFSARLVHLQVTMHEEYSAKANGKHVYKLPIFARRGTIQDVHGEMLAQNEPIKTVIADGSLIRDHAAVARILARALEMNLEQLTRKLATRRETKADSDDDNDSELLPSRYIVIKRKVGATIANDIREKLEAAKLRGIHFEQDSERVYPNGQMLCHVVGYVNSENLGVEGIEKNLEEYLHGYEGFRYIERDRTGKELVPFRGQERAPRDGYNVQLTIDMGLQQIVENELDEACKQFKPKMATVIMMRPQTGEILAMANRPAFDPNVIESSPLEARRNRAITDIYEPGSTFKIVATSTALSLKLISPTSTVFCENGSFAWGGRVLHDHHGYGELNVEEILMHSSNIGTAKLAMQLGEARLYEAVRKYGFGERTGVNLPGEVPGLVHPPHRWSKVSITRVPMGQEVCATPLQVVTAMSSIANGGSLMLPQIIHTVTDSQGNVVHPPQQREVRRVVSPEAATIVRQALMKVVSAKGTAALAHVAGYQVGGKTGTAQKVGPSGTYEHGKYIVSFVGFMPAEAPEFTCLVVLDEAQTKADQNYGGLVAAPVFSRIATRAARYLNLTPTVEEPGSTLVVNQAEPTRD